MNLTKIKRIDLKRGDVFCLTNTGRVASMYMAMSDGDKMIVPSASEDMYRIDVSDDTTDSTSEYIKTLEAKIIRQSRYITKQFDNIDDRDKHIEELEKENRDLKTIAANSESYIHRMDELLASTKRAYESLHQRYDEQQKEIDSLIEDKTVLQDVIQKMIVDKDETVEAWRERVSERNDDIVALRSKINSLNTKLDECFVGRGDDSPITRMRRHISELEELHDIDIHAWSKRESELLEMVESRDRMIHHAVQQNNASMVILSNVNEAMTEMYGIVQDWYDASPNAMIMSTTNDAILKLHKLFCIASANNLFGDDVAIKIDGDRDGTFGPDMADGRHAADLEQLDLLDKILKTLNPRIRASRSLIINPITAMEKDASDMETLCKDVIDFRRKYNIVG